MVAAAYIAQAPEIVIENGVACVTAVSNGKVLQWHLPVVAFRHALLVANAVMANYDHPPDNVRPIKRR